MARHYLDYASTAPLRPEARAAMVAVLDGEGFEGLTPADPSRIHAEGLAARVALEQARDEVAELVGARSREVVFTSGATEAIVAATWGALAKGERSPIDDDATRSAAARPRAHVVLAAVEHSAVRLASTTLAERVGGSCSIIGVDRLGRIDPDEVAAALRYDTALVQVQWANHEVGTVQPVAEIVSVCRGRGVLVHIDAAQAVGRLPIAFDALGADLLSLSGHKLGGPPGTGALLVRRGLRIDPLLVGGDQERARRAGAENVPALAGLGAACAALTSGDRLADEAATSRQLTQRVLEAVASLEGVSVYGDPDGRVPHLVCLGIDGVEPQAVLLGLDQRGIAAHSGSACASEGLEDSPVLEAMGVDAHRSLRISVGWATTTDDVDALINALPDVLGRLRDLGRATG
jgi:cysteine desulfurase